MTERESLVAAVIERPGDDATRLVFADWLDDHGEGARAGFIRASVGASRGRPGSARRAELLDTERGLLADNEAAWLGPWRGRLHDWGWRRGFLHRVRMTATQFLRHGEEMFRAEPVSRLELVNDEGGPLAEDAIRAAVAHPAFAFVRDCAVVPARYLGARPAPGPWLAALAANRHVTRLRRFGSASFDGGGLREVDVRSFCRAGHLGRLRRLNLSFYHNEPPAWPSLIDAIAEARFAPRLRALKVGWRGLGGAGLRRLASDAAFGGLRDLDLWTYREALGEWPALFESPTLTAVRCMRLSADLMPAYARSPMARRVRRLEVAWADMQGHGAEIRRAWLDLIRRAPPPLRLELSNHNPGRVVFAAMRRNGWLREVRELVISGDSQGGDYTLGSAAVLPLFAPRVMPTLAGLNIHEANEPSALLKLAAWPGLRRLESLELTDDYHGRLIPSRFRPEHPPGRLRTLGGVRLTTEEDAVRFLADYPLERLCGLRLSFCAEYVTGRHAPRLPPATAERVMRSPRLARLADLAVGFDHLPEVEARVVALLADPAVLPGLHRLFCSGYYSFSSGPEAGALRARFGPRLA